MTLDAIGIGLIFPVMPDLIEEVTGRPLAEAALWGGVLATSFAVMQFLFGPVIGALSATASAAARFCCCRWP